jgi:hypothetical protein
MYTHSVIRPSPTDLHRPVLTTSSLRKKGNISPISSASEFSNRYKLWDYYNFSALYIQYRKHININFHPLPSRSQQIALSDITTPRFKIGRYPIPPAFITNSRLLIPASPQIHHPIHPAVRSISPKTIRTEARTCLSTPTVSAHAREEQEAFPSATP